MEEPDSEQKNNEIKKEEDVTEDSSATSRDSLLLT